MKCNKRYGNWPLRCTKDKGHDGQHEAKFANKSDAAKVGDPDNNHTYRWK